MTERRLRVVQIGPDPARSQGGMATVIGNIHSSPALNDCFEVSLYPSFRDGGTVARTLYSESRLHRFSVGSCDADVYHIHAGPGRSFWRKLSYLERLDSRASRAVFHIHASSFDETWRSAAGEKRERARRALSKTGRVVVLSEEWQTFCTEDGVCDKEKLVILHNAVDVPPAYSKDYMNKDILFMGRVGGRKGVDVLLAAAKDVLAACPDAHFVICGDGEVGRYQAMVRDMGIADRCIFPGWVDGEERVRLFRECAIYCLPSRHEGMPMSVLEAMSYGLAVVTTPVGGVPQVIEDGDNGLLVAPGDAGSLADALVALLQNFSQVERLGSNGRRTIVDGFGMSAYEAALTELYEEIGRA